MSSFPLGKCLGVDRLDYLVYVTLKKVKLCSIHILISSEWKLQFFYLSAVFMQPLKSWKARAPLPSSSATGLKLCNFFPSSNGCNKSPSILFVLTGPQVPKLCWFSRESKWGRTATSPLGRAVLHIVTTLDTNSTLLLLPKLGCSLPALSCAGLGERLTCEVKLLFSPTRFKMWSSGLCDHLGYYDFLSGVLEFS